MGSGLLELEEEQLEVLRAAALDAQIPTGSRGSDRIRTRLQVIGHDRVLGAAELLSPIDDQALGADALDVCAHLDQQPA